MKKKFALKLTVKSVFAACALIKANPQKYGEPARQRCLATPTKGRYNERRLAAGRCALIEALFGLYPDLQGNHGRLTAAFRAGAAPAEPNWDYINELGAQALNLIKKD